MFTNWNIIYSHLAKTNRPWRPINQKYINAYRLWFSLFVSILLFYSLTISCQWLLETFNFQTIRKSILLDCGILKNFSCSTCNQFISINMKIGLWIIFILVFVWIVSVIVTIINPDLIFGPLSILIAIIGAIIILAIVEMWR